MTGAAMGFVQMKFSTSSKPSVMPVHGVIHGLEVTQTVW